MAPVDIEGYSDCTFEDDEYCVLMAVYEVIAEYRDLLLKIYGRSPQALDRAFSQIREDIADLYGDDGPGLC